MKPDKAPKKAAVIVLLEACSKQLILTERSPRLRIHAGEICFPGGCPQPEDSSLLNTALRELEEELDIHRTRLSIGQVLQPERTLTGYCIYPWIATIEKIEPYQLQQSEVNAIIRVPLEMACNQQLYKHKNICANQWKINTLQFSIEDKIIWGATARIMQQLCH